MDNLSHRLPPPLPERETWDTEESKTLLWRFLKWAARHSVGIPGGFLSRDPSTIQAGVDPDPGTREEGWAASDHVHDAETAAPAGLSNSNTEGSGSALLRADAGIKRDVRVEKVGVDVGTRNALNFSADFTVTDNPGSDRVDVALAGSSGGSEDAELLAWIGL